jgi:hypothetical protein
MVNHGSFGKIFYLRSLWEVTHGTVREPNPAVDGRQAEHQAGPPVRRSPK